MSEPTETPADSSGSASVRLRTPRRRRHGVEGAVWGLCSVLLLTMSLAVRDAIANPPPSPPSGVELQPGFAGLGDPFGGKQRLTVLMVGTDISNGLADTIAIALIDRSNKRIGVVSFPRDLYIVSPGGAHMKINAIVPTKRAQGGDMQDCVAYLEQTLARNFGVRVDAYVRLDVDAFVQLVDYVGGVDLEVPKGLYGKGLSYDDPSQNLHVHLQPGQQHLTGYQAMGFVRWRQYRVNGPGDGDEGRTARQRAFFRALGSRVAGKLSQRNLEAARTAASLAAVAHKYMTTDLSPLQLMAITSIAREVDASGIEGVMVPTEWSGMYGEEWIYRPDPQGTQRAIIDMWAALEGRRSLTDTARVEVLNACGKQSAADQCKRVLGEAGLRVVKLGTALDRAGQPDFSHTATVVRCTEKFARAGERVLAVLQIPGAEIRYDLTENRDVDISVILGSDYPPREVGAVRRAEAGVRVGEQVQAHG